MTEHMGIMGISMANAWRIDSWNDFDAASLFTRRSHEWYGSYLNHLTVSNFQTIVIYFFYLVDTLKWNKNEIIQSTIASIVHAAWLLLTVGSDVACCITHTHLRVLVLRHCDDDLVLRADGEVPLIILCSVFKEVILFLRYNIVQFLLFIFMVCVYCNLLEFKQYRA